MFLSSLIIVHPIISLLHRVHRACFTMEMSKHGWIFLCVVTQRRPKEVFAGKF